jgi:hypothetical protein
MAPSRGFSHTDSLAVQFLCPGLDLDSVAHAVHDLLESRTVRVKLGQRFGGDGPRVPSFLGELLELGTSFGGLYSFMEGTGVMELACYEQGTHQNDEQNRQTDERLMHVAQHDVHRDTGQRGDLKASPYRTP